MKEPGERIWKNLLVRCGSPNCAQRIRIRPAVLTRFRGIEFQNRWYHETACLEDELIVRVRNLLAVNRTGARAHRVPIGLLLVQRGAITAAELRDSLRLQRQAGGGKLGYWLQQITAVDEEQICAALGQQWGCPVFPLDGRAASAMPANVPPYALLAAAKAVPAFATLDGRQWHIAFSERIDHTLLYAWEAILECKTFACVARESAVNEALDELQRAAENEVCFDSMRDAQEMAATIGSYAAQWDARQIKVERAAGFIWAAFFQRGARRDLLFRVSRERVAAREHIAPAPDKALVIPADIRRDGVWKAGETR